MEEDEYRTFKRRLWQWGLGAVIALVALTILGEYFNWGMTAFFAPKYEQVRRDTMLHSRAYAEGNTHELYEIHRQWLKATPDERQALKLMARHNFENLPAAYVPPELQAWREEVMN